MLYHFMFSHDGIRFEYKKIILDRCFICIVRKQHGANSKFLKQIETSLTENMAEKNTVPSVEANVPDGNPIFTPRQWLERFRQFTKREPQIDIALLPKGPKGEDIRLRTDR